MPHIRLLDPEHGSTSLANLFGLPYVIEAKSRPFDRTTLHNNWQRNGTEAFSLYTGMTGKIDDELATQAVSSILRFLTRMGIIRYYSHSGYIASVLKESDLEPIMTEAAGIFIRKAECGQEVSRGDVLAQIMKADSGDYFGSYSTNRRYHFLRRDKACCLFKSFGISDNQENSSVKNLKIF